MKDVLDNPTSYEDEPSILAAFSDTDQYGEDGKNPSSTGRTRDFNEIHG